MVHNRTERNLGLNHGMERCLKIKAYYLPLLKLTLYLLATNPLSQIYCKKIKINVRLIVGSVTISNKILIVGLICLSDFHLLVYQAEHFNSLHDRDKKFVTD